MKNSTLLFIMITTILLIGGFLSANFTNAYINNGKTVEKVNEGSLGNSENGDIQKITLSTKNYNYYPSTITVKAGKPVSITLDSSVQGCLRAFTIRDLGVQKYSKNPSETINFTPTKKGTFRFSCSMGMGYGTIIVE